MRRLLPLLVVILVIPLSLFAKRSDYSGLAEVSPRQITVGDPVEVTITIGGVDPSTTIAWPIADRFAPAELLKMDTVALGANQQGRRYTISLYKPGVENLPDVPVLVSSPTETDTVWIRIGQVTVVSVLETAEDTTDIRDIRPPVKLKWTFQEILPYLIGAVSAILLALVGLWLWRKYKRDKGEIVEEAPPPPPAHKVALAKLSELKLKKLWQNGFIKEYHSELTDILKEYIGNRWEFNAPEMTSEELLDHRAKWMTDEENYHLVRRVVTSADLVKFAKYKPEPSENEQNWEWVHSFVYATKLDESAFTVKSPETTEVKDA